MRMIDNCPMTDTLSKKLVFTAGNYKERRRRVKAFTRDLLVYVRIMLNGIGELSSVSTTNVYRGDGDVLLNTLNQVICDVIAGAWGKKF